MSKIHLSVLIMVKNEKKRIHVTLESIKNIVDTLFILDTGSTDETIEIIKTFCKENNIQLYLKQEDFVNFEVSRNVLLEYVNSFDFTEFCLLLDVNDELKGDKHLIKLCEKEKNTPNTGFLLIQEWWSGHYDRYFNVRLIKAKKGWLFTGVVHEYISDKTNNVQPIKVDDNNIIIYQDRTKDDDKSMKRFSKDKELLLTEHKKNPTDTRTVFYLAQTFSCLNDIESAYIYYRLRGCMHGFVEEIFTSHLKCGDLSILMRHPWEVTMGWYMKAFELIPRAEPAVRMAEYYKNVAKNMMLAYTFANMACQLPPTECILFVDKMSYEYNRWHVLGAVAHHMGKFEEGRNACLKAIEVKNLDIDKENLKLYDGNITTSNVQVPQNRKARRQLIKHKNKLH